jgi:hypothetical protein
MNVRTLTKSLWIVNFTTSCAVLATLAAKAVTEGTHQMRPNIGSAIAAMALASISGAALAQTSSTTPSVPSLVTVDLRNVLNDLAVRLKLDRANVPVTAQIPITVAANVCGVSVNVLAASTGGQAACTAKTGSVQLAQAVQQQMAAGGSVAGSQSGGAAGVGGTAVGSLGGSTGGTATGGTTSTGMGSTTGQTASNTPSTTTGSTTGATTGSTGGQTASNTGSGSQTTSTGSTTGGQTASNTGSRTGAGSTTGAASAGSAGQPASTTAGAPGKSAYAPGHKKKVHHSTSARAYAPGQQTR